MATKNLLFGIALLIAGLYGGVLGGWFLLASYVCFSLGLIYFYSLYGLGKEDPPSKGG